MYHATKKGLIFVTGKFRLHATSHEEYGGIADATICCLCEFWGCEDNSGAAVVGESESASA